MLQGLCGMRLNTAGVVIGWLGIVGSFVGVILLSLGIGYADDLGEMFAHAMKEQGTTVNPGDISTLIVFVGSVYLALTIINLLASGMLVLGTIKERHLMLLPWLINSAIGLVISVLYNIGWIIVISQHEQALQVMPSILLSSLGLMLQFYIYYGIYSLFKHIQATRDQQRPLIITAPTQHVNSGYPNYTKI